MFHPISQTLGKGNTYRSHDTSTNVFLTSWILGIEFLGCDLSIFENPSRSPTVTWRPNPKKKGRLGSGIDTVDSVDGARLRTWTKLYQSEGPGPTMDDPMLLQHLDKNARMARFLGHKWCNYLHNIYIYMFFALFLTAFISIYIYKVLT